MKAMGQEFRAQRLEELGDSIAIAEAVGLEVSLQYSHYIGERQLDADKCDYWHLHVKTFATTCEVWLADSGRFDALIAKQYRFFGEIENGEVKWVRLFEWMYQSCWVEMETAKIPPYAE